MKSSFNPALPYLTAESSIKAPAWLLVKVLPFSQHLIKYISGEKIVKTYVSEFYAPGLGVKSFSPAAVYLIQGVLSDRMKSLEMIPLFFEGVESPVTVEVGAIVSSRLKWDWVDESGDRWRELEQSEAIKAKQVAHKQFITSP